MSQVTEIDCPAKFDADNLEKMYQKLLQALNDNEKIIIKANSVQNINTVALQMLTSFCKTAKKNDIEVVWENPSSIFSEQAKLLGVHSYLF